MQRPLELDGLGTGHTDGPMVQWSHSFWVVQWPKSHSRPITQRPKKFPCSYCWPLFCNVCACVRVCMRFSPLAKKLCSTNHEPLFSGPNRIHPIHILLTLILSTGPNSSFHQSRTVFEGPRMLYLFTHVRCRLPSTNHKPFSRPKICSLFTLLTI